MSMSIKGKYSRCVVYKVAITEATGDAVIRAAKSLGLIDGCAVIPEKDDQFLFFEDGKVYKNIPEYPLCAVSVNMFTFLADGATAREEETKDDSNSVTNNTDLKYYQDEYSKALEKIEELKKENIFVKVERDQLKSKVRNIENILKTIDESLKKVK